VTGAAAWVAEVPATGVVRAEAERAEAETAVGVPATGVAPGVAKAEAETVVGAMEEVETGAGAPVVVETTAVVRWAEGALA